MECAAGCGVALHPAAAAGGFDRHPGCEPRVPTTEWRAACVRCGASKPAESEAHALQLLDQHDERCTAQLPRSEGKG